MKPILIAVPVSLVAGIALGAMLLENETDQPGPAAVDSDPTVYFDTAAPVDARLEALERIVAEERDARMVLEDQITMLLEEIERIDAEGPDVLSADIRQMLDMRESIEDTPPTIDRVEDDDESERERRVSQLVEGGFSPDRAEWLVDRVTEMQFEAMQLRYEAMQSDEPVDISPRAFQAEYRLRDEIGDAEYEQYLEAFGRPSVVDIQSVMATSPASNAGLQAGDRIVSYNGERVFNMLDLRQATFGTDPGTDVVVDIERDGVSMQIVMPAGPMGITGVGGRRNWGPGRRRGG